MIRFAVILCVFLLPAFAFADVEPMYYSRGTVLILPKAAADKPEADAKDGGTLVQVEIRDAATLANPDWFRFNTFKPATGLLLVSSIPEQASLEPMNEFAPADILLLDEYGTISQIFPKLVLAELQEPLLSDAPVRATLYLKGGTVEQLDIKPGDVVRYKLFKKKTIVMRSNDAAAEPAAPQIPTSTTASKTPVSTAQPAAPKAAKTPRILP